MSAARTSSLINSWNTIRYELLNTRICDLGLTIEGSPLEAPVERIRREFAARALRFQPSFYLTNSWGCPDEVPVIGSPFYLADKRLRQIEEEQTGEVEDDQLLMMFLRHEAGHAVNYAYRLWERTDWTDMFGRFSKPYRDSFQPNLASREFVWHIPHSQYGRHYAQKHPDEDFAETFAVWLTPRSAWRRKYGQWPALRKLRYVDDKLRDIFQRTRGHNREPAHELLVRHHDKLLARVARWSGLGSADVGTIITKLEDRTKALGLVFPLATATDRLMDVTALATALAMDVTYMGRFTE